MFKSGLRDITRAIDRARQDNRVDGIMAVLKPYTMGLGKVQEIRDSIIAFRAAGKWAKVYLDTAGEFSGCNSPGAVMIAAGPRRR